MPPHAAALIFDLADTLETLLNSMVASVVAQWQMPLGEVRSWSWRRLQAAHSQVQRERYDAHLAQVQAIEAGQVRATLATHGKRVPAYKTFDELGLDPWTPIDDLIPADDAWAAYKAANDLEH